MEERNIEFQNYINAFKELDYSSKKEELINSFKEFIVMIDSIAGSDKISLEYLHSNEILDFNNNNKSDADFVEAVLVYLEVAKDLIGQYLLKKENL